MMIMLLLLCLWLAVVSSIQIVDLQPSNFELEVSSRRYLAVLFHSSDSTLLENAWKLAATKIDSLCNDCDMAQVISFIKFSTRRFYC